MNSAQERTEKPTPKRLEDARKKGQIARSADLAAAAASAGATLALAYWGSNIVARLAARTAHDLARLGEAPLRVITPGEITAVAGGAILALCAAAAPVAIAAAVASIGINVLQGGWNVSMAALQPNWSRLSPAAGLRRLAPGHGGANALKMAAITAAISWIAWIVTRSVIAGAERLAWLSPEGSARAGWEHTESLLLHAAAVLAVVGLADYGLQWYRLRTSLMMTRQEVRDEARQNEGSAETKIRIRRVQRELARRRMMRDVARATVVITNPTHYAVALEYRREAMSAPVVLAKGRDHLALAIRAKAREHGVPIVENRTLAHALHATVDVGEAIPASLFAAVAEVLAYLVRARQLVL